MQPDPRQNSKELFLDELDLWKEFIHVGFFLDCLVISHAFKNQGIVCVIEDKKGNFHKVSVLPLV